MEEYGVTFIQIFLGMSFSFPGTGLNGEVNINDITFKNVPLRYDIL